ncbi:DUF3251 domain-containing protein [Erwinia sorbitola]|uniref:DUF3251 domain-containing protein n=1 Tax=Erwinia sorbitola TaxID=2681984 RepID=A0A6I6F484_9GAMM|nr:DUF3251 domain-containing protein [Erwinia sorbitola]QGU88690.1 DUF3251 domain-containing protein [Erwinia sorbitola]
MTSTYLRLSLGSLLLLAGCASTPPQPKLTQLHNEVGKLTQQMRQLTSQAAALEQQGNLNSGSTQGAWLLPAAKTGVILKSQAGELKLSLSNVQPEANGTRAILHIRASGNAPLPAFTAQVEWGELDSTTSKPLTVNSQVQQIEVPATLLAKSEATVSLRLSNLPPEQLGYVRVHDVVVTPATSSTSN